MMAAAGAIRLDSRQLFVQTEGRGLLDHAGDGGGFSIIGTEV